MKRTFAILATLLVMAAPAAAHFVFVVPSADGQRATVVFSEDLEADENVPIDKIKSLKLRLVTGEKSLPIEWKAEKHSLVCELAGSGQRTIAGSNVYGVLQRGNSKPFLLNYHPKAILGNPFAATKPDPQLPIEVFAVGEPGKLQFLVTANGKPLPKADVSVIAPGKGSEKAVTDEKGLTRVYLETGRYAIWARTSVPGAGELDGKKYEETRHYGTLVIDVPGKK